MLIFYFALFLAILPAFVYCGDGDRDTQVGQVPVKDSPVKSLNNVTLDIVDLSMNRGCRGRRCRSHRYQGGNNVETGRELRRDRGNSEDYGNACDQPRDEGDCQRSRIRWYFSSRSGICRRFRYSGCGGNSNNFRSRRRCEAECSDYTEGYVEYYD